jgi:lactoylglutathione lyase
MTSLSLLVLRAANPAHLARFYNAFGLKFRIEQHGDGPIHHTCDLDGAVLEIYPALSPAQSTAGARLGFRVRSVEESVRACSESGRIISSPKESPWGYRAVVEDPEGHRIELTESHNLNPKG